LKTISVITVITFDHTLSPEVWNVVIYYLSAVRLSSDDEVALIPEEDDVGFAVQQTVITKHPNCQGHSKKQVVYVKKE